MKEKISFTTNSCTLNKEIAGCFEKLSYEEMLLLEENNVFITYKKGETLCKQNTLASHVMFLCSGLAKVYLESNSGSLILKVLPPGNIIGLTALLDGSNFFQYSAYAYQDCNVRLIDISIFKKLILINPAFANEIINLLCKNLIQLQTRFFGYTQKQSYGRMADTLLCLSCNIFETSEFRLELSRKELAELSGLTTESVIRIITKFKNDELISEEGKIIRILNEEKLRQISEYG